MNVGWTRNSLISFKFSLTWNIRLAFSWWRGRMTVSWTWISEDSFFSSLTTSQLSLYKMIKVIPHQHIYVFIIMGGYYDSCLWYDFSLLVLRSPISADVVRSHTHKVPEFLLRPLPFLCQHHPSSCLCEAT